MISQWLPHFQVISQEWNPIRPHLAHLLCQGPDQIHIEQSSLPKDFPDLGH
jgi:hypothetical protein